MWMMLLDVWRSNVRSAMFAASQLPGGESTDVDDAPRCVRSNVRSAMCAASQLPGGEPTDVDDAPGCGEIQYEICHVCS